MSSVDERIVEMRFDNQQFESGVQKSLKTLNELKSGLNLEGSAKSFETLQQSANSLDLSGIASGVDAVSNRVSALGIVGDQVIRYLTNQFIQLGESATQAVKSLTIDQVGAGFDKYERKTKAVQTIMNATGESIESVTASLEKLGWFTDETSYGYSDMVDNIGKFTSNNIKLDSAVTSMIGIANAAGLAGASVSDAAHAMEGFSKAMGRGSMDSRSWNWIQTAHMDTTQFKQTLIDAAVEVGTLDKVMSKDGQTYEYFVHGSKKAAVSIADFQNELSKGWLNVDAMTLALHQFGGATEEVYKIFQEHGGEMLTSEIISKYGSSLDKLGIQAFKASQEARTFNDAIDSVKEAVSTSWMQSFEYIFGNKDEAVALWTEVANEMWDVFASGGKRRNEILEMWHNNGGYQAMLDGIRNAWEGIKEIGGAVKETFSSLFPEVTSDKLVNISKKFNALTKSFRDNFVVSEKFMFLLTNPRSLKNLELLAERGNLSKDLKQALKAYKNIQKLKSALGGFKSVIELFKTGIKSIGKILSPVFEMLHLSTGSFLDFAASVGEGITNFVNKIIDSEFLKNITEAGANAVRSFLETITSLFGKTNFKELIGSVTTKVKELVTSFIQLTGSKIQKGFQAITGLFDKLIKNSKLKSAFDLVKNFFINLWSKVDFQKIGAGISSVFSSIVDFVKDPDLSKISDFGKKIWSAITGSGVDFSTVTANMSNFGIKVTSLIDTIKGIFSGLDFSNLTSAWESTIQVFSRAKEVITDAITSIKESLENADWKRILSLVLGFSAALMVLQLGGAFASVATVLKTVSQSLTSITSTLTTSITSFCNKLGSLPTKIGNTFDALTKAINDRFKTKVVQFAEAALLFAGAVLILTFALKSITDIPETDLIRSGIALGGIMVVLATVIGILGKLNIKGTPVNYAQAAIGIAAFTLAILGIAGAFKLLETINWKHMLASAASLALVIAALLGVAFILSNEKVAFNDNGRTLLSFSLAVLGIAAAIKLLSSVVKEDFDVDAMAILLAGITTMIVAFSLLQRIGSGHRGVGIGVLAMVASFAALIKILDMLGGDKSKELINNAKTNVGLIAGIFGALTLLVLLSKAGGENSLRTGFGILALTASLLVLYSAIKKFGKLRSSELVRGVGGIALLLAALRIYIKTIPILSRGQKAAKIGGNMIAIASSMLILYFAVKKFGNLDTEQLIKGVLAISALMTAFGFAMKLSAGAAKAGQIIALTFAMITMIAGVALLSMYSWSEIGKGVSAIAGVLLSIGLSLNLIGKTTFSKSQLGGIGLMLAAIAEVIGGIWLLKDVSWTQCLTIAGSIAGVLVAIGVCMRLIQQEGWSTYKPASFVGLASGILSIFVIGLILQQAMKSNVSWDGAVNFASGASIALLAIAGSMKIANGITIGSAFNSIVGIIEWILGLAAVVGVLSGVAYFISNVLGNGDRDITECAAVVGNMIGSFFGGLFGSGVAETGRAFTRVLPGMAQDLSDFASGLQGFITGISGIPEGFGTKLGELSKGIMVLAKAGVKDTWADFIDLIPKLAGTRVGYFAKFMSLGLGLRAFNTALNGIDADKLCKNAESLGSVITAFKDVPTEGGLFNIVKSWFVGTTDYEGFSEGMSQLGKGLGSFYEATKDLKIDNMETVATAFGSIMEMFNSIPEQGNGFSVGFRGFLLSFADGTITWDTITNGLIGFGTAMIQFSDIMANGVDGKKPDLNAIQRSIKPTEQLTALLEAIPETGGLDQKLNGEVTWSTISTGLAEFGSALVAYSASVSGEKAIDIEAIKNSAIAGEALSTLEGKIPTAGSWWQKTFGGEHTWSTVSEGLVSFGQAIVAYSNELRSGYIDYDKLETASNAVEKIVEIGNAFKADANGQTVNLSLLGQDLSSFAGHLKGMSDMMVQFDTEAVTTVLEALKLLAESKELYSGLGGEIAEGIVEKFKLGLNADSATSIIAEFTASLGAAVGAETPGLQALGTDFVDSIIVGIRSGQISAVLDITTVTGAIVAAAETGLSGMTGVGINAGAGLIAGIASQYAAAYAAGYTLGRNVVTGAEAGLDEASPSKEMARVGRFAGLGLSNGLLSMSSHVADSAEKMVEDSILSVSSIFDVIDSALAGDLDYNPVITPVLDLSAVSYGASQIDGILNNQSSLKLAGEIQDMESRRELNDLLIVGRSILREIQNGSDLYFDDGVLAGRINRRLGAL